MTKNNLGGGIVACAFALAAFVSSIQAQNGIEPRYERYNADRKSIEVDGNLDDWAGVNFIEPLFEASDGRETGKGNSTIGETTYSTFAEFAGGTWSGPDDHKTSIAVAWDQEGLYLGIVVTDDEHEHAANNAWNGDGNKQSEGKFLKGKRNGLWEMWFDNGKPDKAGNFVNGKPDGLQVFWHTNQVKSVEWEYKNGMPHGKMKRFHENGKLEQEGSYDMGMRTGEWFAWDENGKKVRTALFDQGKLIKENQIDKPKEISPKIK